MSHQATKETLSLNRSKILQNVVHLVILHFYIMRRHEEISVFLFHFDLTNDVHGRRNSDRPS
jgi:hypothetical protein